MAKQALVFLTPVCTALSLTHTEETDLASQSCLPMAPCTESHTHNKCQKFLKDF